MLLFFKTLSLELNFLVRKVYIFAIFLVSIIYLNFGYNIMVIEGLRGINFLETITFFVMILTMGSMVLGILNATQEKRCNFEELSNVLPGFWRRHFAKIFSWSLISLIYSITVTIVLIYFFKKDNTGLEIFSLEIFLFNLLQLFIPMISFWIIGYSIEKMFKKTISWPLLISLWYFTLPFDNFLYFPVKMALNQYTENPDSGSFIHFGINTSFGCVSRKLWFLLFGIGLFILSLLFKNKNKIQKNFKSLSTIIILIFIFIFSFFLSLNSINFSSEELKLLHNYKDINLSQLLKKSNKTEPSGKVTSMEIELGKADNNKLNYKITMDIEKIIGNEIIFTLYRSLNVKNMKINNEQTQFIRKDDLLIINGIKSNNIKITFDVSGKLPNTIGEITQKTLLLTYDNAWYPILGNHQILIPINIGNYKVAYTNNQILSKYKYDLIIKSNRKDIITNLSDIKGISFKGKDYGPLIIQGKYNINNVNGLTFVAPVQLYNYYSEESSFFRKHLKTTLNTISSQYNIEIDTNIDKIFFVKLNNNGTDINSTFKRVHSNYFFDYYNLLNPDQSEKPRNYMNKQFNYTNIIATILWEKINKENHYIRGSFIHTLVELSENGDTNWLQHNLSNTKRNLKFNNLEKHLSDEDKKDLEELKKINLLQNQNEIKFASKNLLESWIMRNRSN
ncbi:MAG: hypothetical protein ABF289_11430 [Clostridiales bacterium]